MVLSAIDSKLMNPVGSGGGSHFYDFETLYTAVSEYPFLKPGEEIGQHADNPNLENPFRMTKYLHEILHYYQHLCTTVGQFQAICRYQRINYGRALLDNPNKQRIRERASGVGLQRRPLFERSELPMLENMDHDPLVPDAGFNVRLEWYRTLAGEKSFLSATAAQAADPKIAVNIYSALLAAERFWQIEVRQDSTCFDRAVQVYKNACMRGLELSSYVDGNYRRPIDTIHIIENFCSVWEIVLPRPVNESAANQRFAEATSGDYLTASRFVLWSIEKEFTPSNIYEYSPELMLLFELALNPPIPPFCLYVDRINGLSWSTMYPPSRLAAFAEAAKDLGSPLTIGNHGREQLKQRMEAIKERAGIPCGSVLDAMEVSTYCATASRLISDATGTLRPGMEEINWYQWFSALQKNFIENCLVDGSITSFLFNQQIKSEFRDKVPYWEPPTVLEGGADNLVASYMTKNQSTPVLFALENLQSYMITDLIVGHSDVSPLPFGITEEMFCGWGLLKSGQYESLVRQRLGFS